MQVEAGLVQMRETAYGKVLQCLPYPRELVSPASWIWQCALCLVDMAMPVMLLSTNRGLTAACGRPLSFPTYTGCPLLAPHPPQMTCLLLSFSPRTNGTGFEEHLQLLCPSQPVLACTAECFCWPG